LCGPLHLEIKICSSANLVMWSFDPPHLEI
jgi:hypothetical protein